MYRTVMGNSTEVFLIVDLRLVNAFLLSNMKGLLCLLFTKKQTKIQLAALLTTYLFLLFLLNLENLADSIQPD